MKIVIQPGEGDLGKGHLTQQVSPSSSEPSSASPPPQRLEEQQAAESHGDTAREVITNKVHGEEQ